MPQPLKKRGRRAEKQQHKAEDTEEPPAKKRKISEAIPVADQFEVTGNAGDDFISFGQGEDESVKVPSSTTTFYGLLTEEEQQYYTNVNAKISANDFGSDEDRKLFIEAVYRDLAGKEIKIASSQSCSRFLERIILVSNPQQLTSLFQAFLQDLRYLIQHRFGSHCCEALFLRAAKDVSSTPKHPPSNETNLESCFLTAAEQMKDSIGYLLTERFASHTIRLLLLILAGEPLDDETIRDVVASRKKENLENDKQSSVTSSEARRVSDGFKNAARDLVQSAISTIDTTYLRALATHPTGNPVLQLLLRLESSHTALKEHQAESILVKLIPDLEFDPNSESSRFVSALVYDPTGAHLVQTLVRVLPGKAFKKMYKNLFKDRIGKLAKNEIASYVAVSIFERVGKDDLSHASDAIVQELPGLFERNRLAVIRHLIQRCSIRAVDLKPIGKALEEICGEHRTSPILKMLEDPTKVEATEVRETTYDNLQGSLLLQTMLHTEQLSKMVQESLIAQSNEMLEKLAKNTISSRVIQVSLTATTSSAQFRRLLVPQFYSMIEDLAVDPSGSHVVDALWTATDGSHFMKERIAKIIHANEQKLRDSLYGRAIWRNWNMDVYQRRPGEWHANAKSIKDGQTKSKDNDDMTKTPIQLARERHVQKASRRLQKTSAVGNTVAAEA